MSRTQTPWQFSLGHLFILTALVAVFFSLEVVVERWVFGSVNGHVIGTLAVMSFFGLIGWSYGGKLGMVLLALLAAMLVLMATADRLAVEKAKRRQSVMISADHRLSEPGPPCRFAVFGRCA
jgi:hypothetical protein